MGRKKVDYKDEKVAKILEAAANKKNREGQLAAMSELAEMVAVDYNLRAGFINPDSDEAQALLVNPAQMIQEATLPGDTVSDIFEINMIGWDEQPMYPMDLITPGNESDYIAYTMPNTGRIPQRHVEGDEITLNTYRIANAIDWDIRYSRAGRIDVVRRATEVLENGFTQKRNNDGWHTILAAGLDRGLMVYDSNATAGQLTKKLLQLMKIAMVRNGGGNNSSMNKFQLTDLYISPEAMEDIASFSSTEISDINRAEVERDPAGMIKRLMGINVHVMTELGESQEYTDYYTNASALAGSLAASDVELVIGLDLSKTGIFVSPVRGQGLEVYPDDTLLRSNENGLFSSMELSYGVLDSRGIILGSL